MGVPCEGLVFVVKNHYPRSREHFLIPSPCRHTHPFGGLGLRLVTSTVLPTEFKLMHGGDAPLSSTATAVSAVRTDGKHRYEWSLTVSPWSDGEKVAVALKIDQSEATGKPTITGTTTVGQTLTADKGDIADANGLSDPLDNLEYQWIRVDESTTPTTETDISGATSSTYVLQAADFGKKIKVKLTFKDRAGFEESRTSDATATIDVLTLHSDNGVPRGVWGNDDTIWVAEDDSGTDNKIFAYNRATGARDSSKDFDTLDAAGNKDIQGIWSDGTTMFVVDYVDDKLYAYTVSTKARDSGKDITLISFNDEPRGIWGNADTIWVAQDGTGTDNKIFAYRRSNGNRDSSKDFDTLDGAGNTDVEGMWSDGITMWVADSNSDKVYAYKMADESRDPDKDFDLVAANDDPKGMWSDGDTVYVVDPTDDKLYLYQLEKPNATGAPAVRGPGDTAAWSATLTAGVGNVGSGYLTDPTSVGSLSPGATFTLESVTYTVENLYDEGNDNLTLDLDREIPVAFTLNIDGTPSHSGNAIVSRGVPGGGHQYTWHATGVVWSNGSTAQVSLTPYTERVFAVGEALVADTFGIRLC